MKNFINDTKEKLTKSLQLPEEILLEKLNIEIMGNEKMNIINHKGIIFYSPENIRINTSSGLLSINGKDLLLSTLISEELIIEGQITSIEYII
ncbi:sporulation protein YqfC [Anaerofustis stercorihominis]|uniref:Sporulation protein YqfC n=2 Tax=Anaerofustis stercorihominis TaxID=214853 RepID=B1C5M3_9FIRM|nr:sporulation protein YqfC [Anaerofustis stercorihominis]EDS73655.1 putative sporulation protein YqfC [Anaerofustis stercorihominis DSM 17244]MCQ4795560.1 sporulation protein YqfC [Anaerofustis stercorihominis]RGD72858.1 sporulation protein YqfC [Anaerofustis stercorihominis]